MSTPLKLLSITTALLGSGGILTLTLFDTPLLQSQPASRSLPLTRWLFSRGSHIFPTASFLSTAGFVALAYTALPAAIRAGGVLDAVVRLLKVSGNGARANGYLVAAALCFAIGPWTSVVMIPTNFRLIELNERRGGGRSAAAAKAVEVEKERKGRSEKPMTAEESVDGKGMPSQWTDLSGPQENTEQETSAEEDEEVRALLGKFGWMNAVRAVLLGAGGVVGLWSALL